MTRPPPARLVHAATAIRTTLQNVTRRMVPPEIGLLELASGFMSTHVVYTAARLGIADVLANGPLSADDVAAEWGRIRTLPIGCFGHARPSECSARAPTDASS